MDISTSDPALNLTSAPQQPIVIAGTPRRLRGSLALQNSSDEKLKLKSLSIQSSQIRDERLTPLEMIPLFQRLEPNESRDVEFEFAIDPATPPGDYAATITVGAHSHPAQILIDEHVELEVEPDTITLLGGKRRSFDRYVEFRNLGNIELTLEGQWQAVLKPYGGLEDALFNALAELAPRPKRAKAKIESGPEQGLGMLDSVLQAIAKRSPGQVSATFDNVRLMPGESTRVKAEFSLPAELEAGTHYVGHFSVFSAEFTVEVFVRK